MKQIRNYEETIKTIVYGGAFNPPTRAHQAILQACVDHASEIDADVWLMPSGDRTDKKIDSCYERRLDMLRALTNDVVRRSVDVHTETTELYQHEQTETYDTVLNLQDKYPDRNFIWVYGSDSVNTMNEWEHGEWLLENLQMLVVERSGFPISHLGRLATRLPVDCGSISSTEVRNRLAAKEDIEDLVSPTVLKYLHT